MAYAPTDWIDDVTPVSATKLNNIEQRITYLSKSGTFADTTTVIPAGGTYTKTIPLGFEGVSGSLFINGYGSDGFVFFNADPALSRSIGKDNGSSAIFFREDGFLVDNATDGSARLQRCYIDGTNLVLIFGYNSAAETLAISSCTWEVQA